MTKWQQLKGYLSGTEIQELEKYFKQGGTIQNYPALNKLHQDSERRIILDQALESRRN